MSAAAKLSPSVSADAPLPPEDVACEQRASALERLYRMERPRLVRLFTRQAGRDVAEDAIQQVFLRLTSMERDQTTAIASPTAYLQVATRRAVNHAARLRSRAAPTPDQVLLTSHIDPLAQLEARDRLAHLGRAVQRLKPLTRDIFLAARVDGYSYEEIAQQTGLSVRGVEKQMRTALRLLGRHLRQNG